MTLNIDGNSARSKSVAAVTFAERMIALSIVGVIGTLRSADGLVFPSPCTILRMMKVAVGSS